jgi:ATP-dependent DNA helicase DinG
MPLVNEVTLDEYSEAIAANVGSVAQITDGKILVLFTSYEMLRKTYQLLKEDETLDDFIIMGQGTGSGSRSRLTKNFRQFGKAILLGTSSFWEGVDFPGDELTALMIVRLPFASPDEPIVAARCQRLENSGKNAFYHYSLPEAVLRFKQGFGRLIRNESDRGILFVLDNRIVSTRYGKDFLESIPDLEIEKKPMHILTHSIEDWIK